MDIITYIEKRSWKYPEEKSFDALCFALENKRDQRFMLVEDDKVENMYNIHFCCSEANSLSESEKQALVNAINEYIKPGYYLGTCGISTRGGEHGFTRFYFDTANYKDTHCIRTLHDKWDNHITYFKILQRI